MPKVAKVRIDGERLQAAIDASPMTRTGVAARAGISESTVQGLLSGRAIGRRSALAVAKALRVPFADLLPNEGESSEAAVTAA